MKILLVLLMLGWNLTIWGCFVVILWKACYFTNGVMVINFNVYGEMFVELGVSVVVLMVNVLISACVVSDYVREG